jgi:hypothetical protein
VSGSGGTLHVARAEMVLIYDDLYPLADIGITPDPMWRFMRTLIKLDMALGDSGSIIVDLLPLTPGERRRRRRRIASKARRSPDFGGSGKLGGAAGLGELLGASSSSLEGLFGGQGAGMLGQSGDRAAREAVADLEAERYVEALATRLRKLETAFRIQVLIRIVSPDKDRARLAMETAVACFDQFTGRNGFKVHGFNLGVAFLSSAELPLLRWFFDRRVNNGLFFPLKRSVVSALEVAGWMKPMYDGPEPDSYVLRLTGAQIPPEPPVFEYQPDQVPLGKVLGKERVQLLGARIEDTRLTYLSGQAESGKTELYMNQFIHLARSGHGCLFLDPHPSNIDKLRPYLTSVADRVVEIDFSGIGSAGGFAWNVLSMEGRPKEDIALKTRAVVEAFKSVLELGLFAEQEQTISYLFMAVQSVIELEAVLPEELRPTIFQVGTLLSNEQWRRAVLPHLALATRGFWEEAFTAPVEHWAAPITGLLGELRVWQPAAELLGARRSTYDLLQLMDQGKVVLACTGGYSDTQRLAANLLFFDLLYSTQARQRIPPGQRRPFYAFLDELDHYDGAGVPYAGSGKDTLALLIEQVGRYKLNLFLLNESPDRLTPRTREAILTNRTVLATMALDAKGAKMLQEEWSSSVKPLSIPLLDRFHMLAAVTCGQLVTLPFMLFTVSTREMWAHCRDQAGVSALNQRIARNSTRPYTHRTAAELSELDDRIREWLESHPPGSPPPSDRVGAASRASYGAAKGRSRLQLIPGGDGRTKR